MKDGGEWQLHTSVTLPLGNVPAVSIGWVGTSASLEIWKKETCWELHHDLVVDN
jgi:hypothetical protein